MTIYFTVTRAPRQVTGLCRRLAQQDVTFLKKSNQKTFASAALWSGAARKHQEQKFFASFFQKRSASLFNSDPSHLFNKAPRRGIIALDRH
jgi:hypothetical protein